jgi:deferrochelatase/peroxidase EfeB
MITFGFGPTLFREEGKVRFGLADRQPNALQRLPHFPADKPDPQRSDGEHHRHLPVRQRHETSWAPRTAEGTSRPRIPPPLTCVYGCRPMPTIRAVAGRRLQSGGASNQMTVELWDRQSLSEQERVIGRTKVGGAPLSGGGEFSQPDFHLRGSDGSVGVDRCTRTSGASKQQRRRQNAPPGIAQGEHVGQGLFS